MSQKMQAIAKTGKPWEWDYHIINIMPPPLPPPHTHPNIHIYVKVMWSVQCSPKQGWHLSSTTTPSMKVSRLLWEPSTSSGQKSCTSEWTERWYQTLWPTSLTITISRPSPSTASLGTWNRVLLILDSLVPFNELGIHKVLYDLRHTQLVTVRVSPTPTWRR